MSKKVLLIDDDPSILKLFKRQLSRDFEIETALSGEEGLAMIESAGPFAVVISDKEMPGMDGIEVLTNFKYKSPDTVRIMLTGYADAESTKEAVNKGQIMYFLTKPCPADIMIDTIQLALLRYYSITSEREILEKTLNGSIELLIELLGIANPKAFGRAHRIKTYVNHIVKHLQLPFGWEYELAAMLSQIGTMTLPPETIDKLFNHETLTEREQGIVEAHPLIASRLLENIPRLNSIARIIAAQNEPFERNIGNDNIFAEDMEALGGNLLKISNDFDKMLLEGKSKENIILELTQQPKVYYSDAVKVLIEFEIDSADKLMKSVPVTQLDIGMVLDEDIKTRNGMLIAVKGQNVTYTLMQRLRSLDNEWGGGDMFRVRGIDEEE